jgi:hypothetical protein
MTRFEPELSSSSRIWEREHWLNVIKIAVEERSFRFARQAAMAWLNIYPGDLLMNYWLAKSFILDGLSGQGRVILERVLQVDPEFNEGYQALAELVVDREEPPFDSQSIRTAFFVLNLTTEPLETIPEWAERLRQARSAMNMRQYNEAENNIYRALIQAQDQVLVCLTHVRILYYLQDWVSLVRFGHLYRQRWPECLGFMLALGLGKLALGDEAEGANLLHRCVTMDVAGQVVQRWLGDEHPFRQIWPERLALRFELPVPAEVSARLGWNQLNAPKEQSDQSEDTVVTQGDAALFSEVPPFLPSRGSNGASDDVNHARGPADANARTSSVAKNPWLQEIENELEVLAKRIHRPDYAKADGRFPIYVVFSSRLGLKRYYGEQATEAIISQMHSLTEAVTREFGWGAMVFLPDDPESVKPFGIKPMTQGDAWSFKLALADLDEALAKRGGRIGAVLIVGGDEIVPFHRLPNPTDDVDVEVLSDNPYATRDSNYFIPEWAIGRLPGGCDPDPGLILQALRSMQRYHRERRRNSNWWERWFSFWKVSKKHGLGYSAAVWRRAALATFRPIGRRKIFWVSPPYQRERVDQKIITRAVLGYYNLHGLMDSPEWYGQKDPHDLTSGPDYPIALTPADLVKNGKAPRIVFTEACYGGYILGKNEQDSMALRFLEIGTLALVGSTSISYGAVQSPLVGADLLGYYFWNGLRAGYSAGEALTMAKIALAREMVRRQGFLDGEDQKTLISFTLYGDPLTYGSDLLKTPKRLIHYPQRPKVAVLSDQPDGKALSETVDANLVAEAKKILEPYLPGLGQAEWRVNFSRPPESERKDRSARSGQKSALNDALGAMVLVFQNSLAADGRIHHHFARVSVKQGKIMKISVSR